MNVWTTGSNAGGQLGTGDQQDKRNFTSVYTTSKIERASGGANHTLILCSGIMYGCGSNKSFQLGIDSVSLTTNFIKLSEEIFVEIECDWDSSFGIMKDGKIAVFGDNSHGKLGLPSMVKSSCLTILDLPDKFVSVKCGMRHTLALTSKGNVYGWVIIYIISSTVIHIGMQ